MLPLAEFISRNILGYQTWMGRQVRYRITDFIGQAAIFVAWIGKSISGGRIARPSRRTSIEVESAFNYSCWSVQAGSPAESIPFCSEEGKCSSIGWYSPLFSVIRDRRVPSPKSRRLRSSKPVPSTSATAKRLFE